MDYMREINAFYDWAETNQVSPTGILLWHALMYLANRARWPERLAVPISRLEVRTGMKRGAIFKARAQLKQSGLIDFESRDGNQSAVYTIKSICVHQMNTTVDTNVNTTVDTNVNTTVDHKGTSYPKTKTKTKTKTNTITSEEESADDPPRRSQRDLWFDEFWAVYPKKVGKADAFKAYRGVKVTEQLHAKMLDAVSAAKQTVQWRKENGQFIPNPATWIRQGRWDDECDSWLPGNAEIGFNDNWIDRTQPQTDPRINPFRPSGGVAHAGNG